LNKFDGNIATRIAVHSARLRLGAFGATFGLFATLAPAHALPVPAASISGNPGFAGFSTTGSLDSFGSYSGQCSPISIPCSLSVQSAYADGDMSISATAIDAGIVTGVAAFSFEVVGPSDAAVPVEITASGASSPGEAGTFAVGEVSVFGTSSPYATFVCSSTLGSCVDPSSFSGTYAIGTAPVGEDVLVQMTWKIFVSGSVALDPMITIDPIWLEENPGYSLAFSPNISSSVPEPLTLSLFGAGLVGAAALRRRKRKLARVG